MTIPIKNIYYLLCYAWNKLEEGELVDVAADNESDLFNLLSKVLLNGTKTLLKRGIDKQYITEHEVYQGIKGKVNITDSLRKNLFLKGLSVCEFDELSADILPNQILKTTLQNLIQISSISPILKHDIRTIIYRLHEINTIVLTDTIFHQVQINRNNSFYAFLLNISELIHRNILINEEDGNFQFIDFLRDERQMARLFEEFIRNFYKIEIPEAKVFREDLRWKMASETHHFLPKMQTDISMKINGRKLIIDAKYYKETLQKYYDSEKIHSQNLYQIFAYLKNQDDELAEGILIYPTVQKSLSLAYTHERHTIRIETVNLNQNWRGVKADLLGIIA